MSNKRIYCVEGPATTHLVEASSQAQAVNHVVRSLFTAVVANQRTLVELLGKGVKVETTGEEVMTDDPVLPSLDWPPVDAGDAQT